MIDNAKRASDFLKALAHEGRLVILCIPAEGEKSVSELEQELGLRQPTVSQQLARLRADGLVSTRRRQGDLLQSRQRRSAHRHRRDLRRILPQAAQALTIPVTITTHTAAPARAATLSDIVRLDAAALTHKIRAREVSCVEVMTAYLDHIDAAQPEGERHRLAAGSRRLCWRRRASATRSSRAARPLGPMHGFPHRGEGSLPRQGHPHHLRLAASSRTSCRPPTRSWSSGCAARRRASSSARPTRRNSASARTPTTRCSAPRATPTTRRKLGRRQQRRRGGRGGAAHAAGRRRQRLRRLAAQSRRLEQRLRLPHQHRPRAGRRTRRWFLRRWACSARWRATCPTSRCCCRCRPATTRACRCRCRHRRICRPARRDLKGKRIAWVGDFGGHIRYEPGVLELCRKCAARHSSDSAAPSRRPCPTIRSTRVWQAWLRLRSWQSGATLLPYYHDPRKRALMKPEAVYEIENGLDAFGRRHHRCVAGAHRLVPGGPRVFRALRFLHRCRRRRCSRSTPT